MLFGFIMGMAAYFLDPTILADISESFAEEFPDILNQSLFQIFLSIFLHNIQAAFFALFGGIILGIYPILIAFAVPLGAGAIVAGSFHAGLLVGLVTLAALIPHAPTELFALLVVASFGTRLGFFWRAPFPGTAFQKLRFCIQQNIMLVPLVILLFLISAAIEAFVTIPLTETLAGFLSEGETL